MNFELGMLKIKLNQVGAITSIKIGEEEQFITEQAPFLRVVKSDTVYLPTAVSGQKDYVEFLYDMIGINIKIEIKEYPNYITFEVIEILGGEIDTLIWGPYPTKIKKIIGEVIGVVRDENYAFGMQALNTKTLAGWPVEIGAEFDEKETISSCSVCSFKYSDLAATPIESGSILQAYCRNRTKSRFGNVWGKENVYIEGFEEEDAQIEGSKIALFGCHVEEALQVIGSIEEEQNLPHPLIDGEWVKTSRKAMMSYLITDFGEGNIDQVLDVATQGGFEYIYHPEPFKEWGHFILEDSHFPKGDDSLKNCIEKAEAKNIGVGLHTLTTFTTTNDQYVTPVPDKHLAKVQTTIILEDIDETQESIAIQDGLHFEEVGDLGVVHIGDELIQYEYTDEEDGKFYLMECTRGAFGTTPQLHQKGVEIHKLWDHGYKVLFPDLQLQDAYIQRIVDLYNNVGVKQISFDGLEGCLATGHEDYSICRMLDKCYKGWGHEVINDSSRLHHFGWHIHTRTNWGEPWGAKMREGQIDVRLINQDFYARNLFPRMLGWFLVRLEDRRHNATTPDDIEWMLSKAAGFDAGFAVCMDYNVMQNHGYVQRYMELIKEWERARCIDAFSLEQKERLTKQHSEWHLEKKEEDEWMLYPVDLSKPYVCDPEQLQPGQPGGADWVYTNPYDEQILRFRIHAISTEKDVDGMIENPGFTVGTKRYKFKASIQSGQYLIYEGGLEGIICDKNFNQLGTAKLLSKTEIKLEAGTQPIAFTAEFKGEVRPYAEVTFMTYGEGEPVVGSKSY